MRFLLLKNILSFKFNYNSIKKYIFIFISFALSSTSFTENVYAKTVKSIHGFYYEIPSDYIINNQMDTIKLLELAKKNNIVNQEMLKLDHNLATDNEIKVEYIYPPRNMKPLLNNMNIVISEQGGFETLEPYTHEQVCESTRDLNSNLLNKKVIQYSCKKAYNEFPNFKKAYYFEHSFSGPNIRSHQFMLDNGPGKLIIFTLGCEVDRCSYFLQNLKKIISSVRK